MNAREQRLRSELRSESELITRESLRPLNLPAPDGRARPLPVVQPVVQPGGQRHRRRQIWLSPVAAAASVAVIATAVGIVSHQHLASRGRREPTGAAVPTAGLLQGVVALSARDAWAVGQTRRSNLTDRPLIVHWDGGTWRRVPVPAVPGSGKLDSIAGTSADDLWAVGSQSSGPRPFEPMIMHWNGEKWRLERFAAATKAGGLTGVAVVSATDAWAVGQTGGRVPGALVLHWDGSTWNQVPAPGLASGLLRVTAISANDAWAVGSSLQGVSIAHWNGSSWTRQRTPKLPGAQGVLWSVAADPAGTVWAVGFTDGQHSAELILRWTGTAWHPVPGPKPRAGTSLSAVTVVSPRNVWVAGGGFFEDNTAILHWDGTAWSRLTGPGVTFRGGIFGLAATSADSIWAVGYRGTEDAGVPQILHWNGSRWRRAYGPASTGGLLENGSCGPYQRCVAASRVARRPGG